MAARPTSEVLLQFRAWSQAVSEATGPPGGEHPAVRRGGPVPGPGAEHSAGRGNFDPDDSEDEALRAGGGPGPKSCTWTECGALTVRMMADFAQRL
jgi:hypothetical protein